VIKDIKSGLCVQPVNKLVRPGQPLELAPCDGTASQNFAYSGIAGETKGIFTSSFDPTLCLDFGSPWARTCDVAPVNQAQADFCNPALPENTRIMALVNALTPEEKFGLFNTMSTGAGSMNLNAYEWWNEALMGLADNVGVLFADPLPYATSFPMPILTSCSFNKTLFHNIGEVISTEARAFSNVGHTGLTFWAPNINMFRDPRWGRGAETPGESSVVSSAYADSFVRGMQEGADPRYLKTSACCKHYAGYSLELWNNTDRHHFNAVISDQDLVDYYLPAFQACVTEGRASSIMCSYNAVNGIPSCANDFLLNTVLRGEWGFNGYLTSDCGAVADIIDNHKYTSNSSQTAAATLKSGMDIGCDSYLPPVMANALEIGAISTEDIDRAVYNLISVRMRLGYFDPAGTQPYTQIQPSVVCSAAHQDVAYQAAVQGITLLYNPSGLLPLPRTFFPNVAVVGPNGNETNAEPNYLGVPCGGAITTILEGFKQAGFNVKYAPGCNGVLCPDQSLFPAAVQAASYSDMTIVVLGINYQLENEGLDRVNITFPGEQVNLALAVCRATENPCIIAVMSGGAIDVSPLMGDPRIGSIFYTGYPGGGGGPAFVDLVFGDAVPAGRLTQTFYSSNLINEVSLFDMNIRPGTSDFPPGTNPGRTYMFYTGTPVFPFGFGLSYTTFTYTPFASSETIKVADVMSFVDEHKEKYMVPVKSSTLVDYWVNVTNTGSRDADEVVLGFLVPPGAGTGGVPLKQLFGFERVFVPKGQTVSVYIGVTARDLTFVDATGKRVPLVGDFQVKFGVPGLTEATRKLSVVQ
jgi:beta-glucosidase-like glycosyl hydrolase